MFAAWLLALYVGPGQRKLPQIIVGSTLFLAAIMSKENAILLWPALIAIDLCRVHKQPGVSWRQWFNEQFAPPHIGFALAAAVFLFFRYLVFGWKMYLEGARTRIYEVPMAHVGLVEHILTPFRLLWTAIINIIWPESLCPIWGYPALAPASSLDGDVLLGMAVVALLVTVMIVLWQRRHVAAALIAGMFLMLAIPLQAIPVIRWWYAERWFYLPTIFVAVLVAWVVRKWGRATTVAGLALALVLLPQSWQYATKFKDDLTMSREVVIRQPNNYQGWRCYSAILWYEKDYRAAIKASNQMIERFGDVSDAYLVLLRSYLDLGDGRRALDAINKYEYLRRDIPEPSLAYERRQAEILISRQSSRPAASIPLTMVAD
jgi:hypothetical protein